MSSEGVSGPDVIQVRGGRTADDGSWLYVWVTTRNGRVVYVGGTGLSPHVRTWLHLHDPDPDVGRVAARYPAIATEPADVLLLRLPDAVSRPDAKATLIQALSNAGLLADAYVGDPPTEDGPDDGGSVLDELIDDFVVRIAAHRVV